MIKPSKTMSYYSVLEPSFRLRLCFCILHYSNTSFLVYLNINRLQKVQNAAVRVIFQITKCDHISLALINLHQRSFFSYTCLQLYSTLVYTTYSFRSTGQSLHTFGSPICSCCTCLMEVVSVTNKIL